MTTQTIETFHPTDLGTLSEVIRDIVTTANQSDHDTVVRPSEVNLTDAEGNPVRFTLVENILTDGSKTYDVVVSSMVVLISAIKEAA